MDTLYINGCCLPGNPQAGSIRKPSNHLYIHFHIISRIDHA
ncbi:hypothetical protein CBFG_01871 [Clostridiales bacterium 1_7_47FAA]|nr:hypothetical protein CBFG_01871 [Clostridiales bacterium 1_7_47FAA]